MTIYLSFLSGSSPEVLSSIALTLQDNFYKSLLGYQDNVISQEMCIHWKYFSQLSPQKVTARLAAAESDGTYGIPVDFCSLKAKQTV